MKRIILLIGMIIMGLSFSAVIFAAKNQTSKQVTAKHEIASATKAQHQVTTQSATAIFAGGCFWCLQADFDQVPGVMKTVVGYTGGHVAHPTYEEVSKGGTGHYEAVEVTYDPAKISYAQLLNAFWRHTDPADPLGQFCDKGQQYRAVIFYKTPQELALAKASKEELIKTKKFDAADISTEILPAKAFYPAEEYHQQYYLKNPIRYKFYRYTCGRDRRLEQVWGAE